MSVIDRALCGLAALALSGMLLAKEPFTVNDLVQLQRVSDLQTSPDGRYLAYVLREMQSGTKQAGTDLWLLDLREKNPRPRALTRDPASDSSPRWAPDSRTIYFLSRRSGASQVWRLSVTDSAARRVSDWPLDVGSLKVSPKGNRIAVSMEVLPDCADLQCTRNQLTVNEKNAATGKVFDKLFIRHWGSWSDGTRSHLFTAALDANGVAGAAVDISKDIDGDVPGKPFGDDDDFDFSPDGARIVFSARVAGKTEPWSTNFDLFEAPADGSAQPRNLTAANPAWDAQPTFLKNGDLAYLAMERPGFEADRFQVVIRSASGVTRPLTKNWDRSMGDLEASADGKRLLVTVDDFGQHALFSLGLSGGTPRKLVSTGQVVAFASTQAAVLYALASLGSPAEVFAIPANGGTAQQLTHVNQATLAQRALSEYEQFSFKGWNDETVHGYVMKPYGYAAGRKFPVAFIVHGGPQSSLQNQWNYRWNAQTFAGRGYGVVIIDFHGSPGYGQAFTDSINRDWGGKPLVDLQKGLAAALAQYPWLDGARACALGSSYGGFMVNWIEGNWPDRFQCTVNHDGIFDQRTMYYTTEELWFPEWEHGGPYDRNPEGHEKFNPSRFVTAWRTPMLVVHGGLDFRVPDSQGIATFTALQRRGIDSKLLYFPDENHWVLKPANSVQWYDTVLGWLDRYLK